MSCGCDLTEEERGESLRARSFITSRGMKRFYGSQEKMASRLFEAGGFDEVASIVMEHFTSLGSSHAYVCFNESYVENYQKFQWMRTDTFDENMVLFTHTQQLEIKDGHVYPHFLKRDLLPGELLDREQVIIFFPLHHRHYIMGYIGVSFSDEATPVNFRSTFSLIDLATENVRKRAVLMDMNERLENLYVMDSLTGLYNRFGLEQFGTRFFDEAMAQGKTVKLLFVDMDGMKEINDTLGHESGDQAIKATADILVRSCQRNDFIMRFGGDEFIVIGTDTGEDTAGRIRENVEEYNRNRRESFTLSLSIGEMPVSASDHLTLSECVTRADDRMYEDKKRRKAERN
jgi:diguanylate cyclase (GGDEF)-like protein